MQHQQDDGDTENNVPIDPVIIIEDKLIDENNSIQNLDPLIEPLFDSNEFELNDKEISKEKSPSILTLHSQQSNEITLCSQIIHRYTGIFYALIGSLLFTCTGFIIKQLGVNFFDALLCRFIIQTIILSLFTRYKNYQIFHGSIKLILLQITRMILATSGLLLFYLSYCYIQLPDLTTFRYTQVIWTAILVMIIFHERISIPTICAILLTIIGVICVAQPTFLFNKTRILNQTNKSSRFLGLIFALLCSLSISGSIVLNKKLLVLKIPQSIIMFQFSCLNLLILIFYQIYKYFLTDISIKQIIFTWKYFLAASVSLIQLFSAAITQKAIKLEHPSIISIVQSSDILFAIILQNLFTNEKSNWLVLLGSALVTMSIFLVGSHKLWIDRKKLSREINNIKV